MKYIIHIIAATLSILCGGCVILMNKNFSAKDQNMLFPEKTNLYEQHKHKLRFDGYYCYEPEKGWSNINRKYANNMFSLYPDGTYLGYMFKEDKEDSIGKSVTNLDDFTDMPEKGKLHYGGGIYKIVGDTLIVETYRNVFKTSWDLTQFKYKIVDSCTLKQFEITLFNRLAQNPPSSSNRIYRFVQASPLPSPFEAKVKKKKWMWSNKEDWKAYKQQLKEYLQQEKSLSDTVK